MRPLCTSLALALAGATLTAPLAAQQAETAADSQPKYPTFAVTGRLQAQGYYAEHEDLDGGAASAAGSESNFFLRRARIQVSARLSDRLSFVVQPSFENARGRGDLRLRDAYIDLRLSSPEAPTNVTLRFGQEKRPFGRYELTSSNNLVSIERGAGQGLVPVAYNNVFESSGFLAHDVGVSLFAARGPAELRMGVYNGAGETTRDANDAKSYGARLTVAATPKLNLGASVFSHDDVVRRDPATPDSAARNVAYSLDAQWGKAGDAGLYLLADGAQGEPVAADPPTMRAFTVVAAWNARTHFAAVTAIEPVLRADWSDLDTDGDDDESTLFGAGVGLYFTSRAHLRFMVERQHFGGALLQSGAVVRGEERDITALRSQFAVHF